MVNNLSGKEKWVLFKVERSMGKIILWEYFYKVIFIGVIFLELSL